MADGEPEEPDGSPAPESEPETPPETPPRGFKMDKLDQDILFLWEHDGLGYINIGKQLKEHKNTVEYRVKRLIKAGLAHPHVPPSVAMAQAGGSPPSAKPTTIEKQATGRATLAAASAAGQMATEISDTWAKLGKWATDTFNEDAHGLGETDIFAYLRTAVEYMHAYVEERGPLVDRLHRLEQDNDLLQERVVILTDERELRKELMEMVWLANLQGKPFSYDQLVVLVLGKDPMLQAPNVLRSPGGPRG